MPRWIALPALLPFALLAVSSPDARADTTTSTVEEAATPESAPPEPDNAPKPFKRRPFISLWGGVGFANVREFQLSTPHVYGPLLGIYAGYAPSPHWNLGLEFTSFESAVTRSSPDQPFGAAASWLRTQASCNNCMAPPSGGVVLNTVMLLNTVGPRVDFLPFGTNGIYVGASGGLALLTVLGTQVGGGGTARAGARFTFADIITVGAEGGVQGQAYSGASAMIAYGALLVNLAWAVPKAAPPRRGPMFVTDHPGAVLVPAR